MKPGSVTEEGWVIDWKGDFRPAGDVWIPWDLGTTRNDRRNRRAKLMSAFGWSTVRPVQWPSLPPKEGLMCITRREVRL